MTAPRFTDQHRYPVPYTPAAATNIRTTLERARARIAQQQRATTRKGKRNENQ